MIDLSKKERLKELCSAQLDKELRKTTARFAGLGSRSWEMLEEGGTPWDLSHGMVVNSLGFLITSHVS